MSNFGLSNTHIRTVCETLLDEFYPRSNKNNYNIHAILFASLFNNFEKIAREKAWEDDYLVLCQTVEPKYVKRLQQAASEEERANIHEEIYKKYAIRLKRENFSFDKHPNTKFICVNQEIFEFLMKAISLKQDEVKRNQIALSQNEIEMKSAIDSFKFKNCVIGENGMLIPGHKFSTNDFKHNLSIDKTHTYEFTDATRELTPSMFGEDNTIKRAKIRVLRTSGKIPYVLSYSLHWKFKYIVEDKLSKMLEEKTYDKIIKFTPDQFNAEVTALSAFTVEEQQSMNPQERRVLSKYIVTKDMLSEADTEQRTFFEYWVEFLDRNHKNMFDRAYRMRFFEQFYASKLEVTFIEKMDVSLEDYICYCVGAKGFETLEPLKLPRIYDASNPTIPFYESIWNGIKQYNKVQHNTILDDRNCNLAFMKIIQMCVYYMTEKERKMHGVYLGDTGVGKTFMDYRILPMFSSSIYFINSFGSITDPGLSGTRQKGENGVLTPTEQIFANEIVVFDEFERIIDAAQDKTEGPSKNAAKKIIERYKTSDQSGRGANAHSTGIDQSIKGVSFLSGNLKGTQIMYAIENKIKYASRNVTTWPTNVPIGQSPDYYTKSEQVKSLVPDQYTRNMLRSIAINAYTDILRSSYLSIFTKFEEATQARFPVVMTFIDSNLKTSNIKRTEEGEEYEDIGGLQNTTSEEFIFSKVHTEISRRELFEKIVPKIHHNVDRREEFFDAIKNTEHKLRQKVLVQYTNQRRRGLISAAFIPERELPEKLKENLVNSAYLIVLLDKMYYDLPLTWTSKDETLCNEFWLKTYNTYTKKQLANAELLYPFSVRNSTEADSVNEAIRKQTVELEHKQKEEAKSLDISISDAVQALDEAKEVNHEDKQ